MNDMNIAITDIYGNLYKNDRLFDLNACSIGENLLLPGIELKKKLEEKGHQYHTLDVYKANEVDVVVFQEIPRSWYTLTNFIDKLKYVLKFSARKDTLLQVVKRVPKENRILLIMEPPVVANRSYEKLFHKYFGKILTWNDELVDGKIYHKIFYPQPKPDLEYCKKWEEKKMFTMICGNKTSDHPDELYSQRRKVIDYFEKTKHEFDLYGIGWGKESLKNYKGRIDKKLEVLSGYKFAFCYENQGSASGYITEKIFDCFFANCVPIYWGAPNVTTYIPKNTFIDRRDFQTEDELMKYLYAIDEKEYAQYLRNIKEYLNGDLYNKHFSVQAYVESMTKYILEGK
ncbi:MAG: hypothetical protein IJZ76_11610 [Lachnospiraceae bacterium]|nr:hypothetical protein [Lachnospiraceae bacterium]